ncbi:hypothetical protein ACFSUS_06240 [Spirosoma soli]|uniref:DUF4178 domain-containing protein n=1 Tax=Spirosoma soli TaxID=1770529 RepID=A0ABW5M112_9BACT
MEPSDKSITATDMSVVREGIKRRYTQYHTINRDKYPAIEFNSNRVNYQPLRDSFEEEFFEVRQIDRVNNRLHIPSLNTFAQLFTNDEYIPSRKIFNTCRSYAQGYTLQPDVNWTEPTATVAQFKGKPRPWFLIGSVATLVVIMCVLAAYWVLKLKSQASELVILSHHTGQVASQKIQLEGRVKNADVVWIVVHPLGKDQKFYVQDPVPVKADGTWKGLIFVGMPNHQSDGFRFTIRAYVRPGGSYKALFAEERYEFDSWPEEAELSTESIVVIRGPYKTDKKQ